MKEYERIENLEQQICIPGNLIMELRAEKVCQFHSLELTIGKSIANIPHNGGKREYASITDQ